MPAAKPLDITYLPLDDLEPSPGNPKAHDLLAIMESISEFGFIESGLRDDRTGKLMAGHGRREALIEMRNSGADAPWGIKVDRSGRWLVPVQTGWTSRDDAHAQAVLITLNKLTETGGWDNKKLLAMAQAIQGEAPDLLAITGMTDDELKRLADQFTPQAGDDPGGDGDGGGQPDPGGVDTDAEAEEVAKAWHEAFERLAGDYGYRLPTEMAKPWDSLPKINQRLLIGVCKELLIRRVIQPGGI